MSLFSVAHDHASQQTEQPMSISILKALWAQANRLHPWKPRESSELFALLKCYFSTDLTIARLKGHGHYNSDVKTRRLASFLLRTEDCFTAFNPSSSNGRRITCQQQALRNKGKLKPALGSFHLKHRNIILKPTTNSNTAQVGASTESCEFNLNLCHMLRGIAAASVF